MFEVKPLETGTFKAILKIISKHFEELIVYLLHVIFMSIPNG